MAITAVKPSARLLAFLMVTVLTGCGLTQTVKDGAVSVTQSIFYPQVKTLHLDLRAREGVNNNAKGASLATVVRIYQLKERQAFDNTDYPSLFAGDGQALQADRVAEKDVRLRPGESVTGRYAHGNQRAVCGGGGHVYRSRPDAKQLAAGTHPGRT